MAQMRNDGILTTVFYGNADSFSENIRALSSAAKRISSSDGGVLYGGKIYCFDCSSAGRLRCDGDILDGKKVRQQSITLAGKTYRVRKFRIYENNGVFHHAEAEVV